MRPQKQLRALESFCKLGRRAGPDVITLVAACLEHEDEDVRRAAVEALAQLAEKGDQHAITAVSARLEDGDELRGEGVHHVLAPRTLESERAREPRCRVVMGDVAPDGRADLSDVHVALVHDEDLAHGVQLGVEADHEIHARQDLGREGAEIERGVVHVNLAVQACHPAGGRPGQGHLRVAQRRGLRNRYRRREGVSIRVEAHTLDVGANLQVARDQLEAAFEAVGLPPRSRSQEAGVEEDGLSLFARHQVEVLEAARDVRATARFDDGVAPGESALLYIERGEGDELSDLGDEARGLPHAALEVTGTSHEKPADALAAPIVLTLVEGVYSAPGGLHQRAERVIRNLEFGFAYVWLAREQVLEVVAMRALLEDERGPIQRDAADRPGERLTGGGALSRLLSSALSYRLIGFLVMAQCLKSPSA